MRFRYHHSPNGSRHYVHTFDPVRSWSLDGIRIRTDEIHAWCTATFGPEMMPRANPRWMEMDDMFLFHADADAFEFRMRWC